MIDITNTDDLIGADVYGSDDKKIGTVGQVYVDSDNQTPVWVTVKTGLFGSGESFAPLDNATFDGNDVRVGYDKDVVKDAPRISDDGSLSEQEEDALYSYYGNGSSTTTTDAPVYDQDADLVGGIVQDADIETSDRAAADEPAEGYDTSGPITDDAMTRSEERLNVGTEKVETGRARLRKHIVTEQVTKTVPVSHEEVTLSREPITDANMGDAMAGGDLTSEEHEVVLTGERVVTSKETVPVDRVSLGKETITEQQNVTEDVSHEEIELVQPGTDRDADLTVDADGNPLR